MGRITGIHAISTTIGESVKAFVPNPLPPAEPSLATNSFAEQNRQAEFALARQSRMNLGTSLEVPFFLYEWIAAAKLALLP